MCGGNSSTASAPSLTSIPRFSLSPFLPASRQRPTESPAGNHACGNTPVVAWIDNFGCACYKQRATHEWACGAAGSAPAWHAGGRGFEPRQVHQYFQSVRTDAFRSDLGLCPFLCPLCRRFWRRDGLERTPLGLEAHVGIVLEHAAGDVAGDGHDSRRLSRAIGTDQREHAGRGDLEAETVHRGERAVAGRKIGQPKHGPRPDRRRAPLVRP